MATSKEFRLQTSVIIQLLGDKKFYESCVSYLFMRDQGLAAVEKYTQAVGSKEEGCDGCGQTHRDEKDYVTGVIATFVRISQELHAVSPQHLKPVRDFIAEKLGYQPGPVVLYYTGKGTKQTLTF